MTRLLDVSGVSVAFDGFKAINNLSFTIDAGELRAVIGPNGAGKTTFMDIVTGKTRPRFGHRHLWRKSGVAAAVRSADRSHRGWSQVSAPDGV